MQPFNLPPEIDTVNMAESAVVTDKSLQIKVLGGLALAATLMVLVVQLFLTTSTLRNASLVLLATIVLTITYLTFDL